MDLIDRIRETIALAEDGKIPAKDFDVVFRNLSKEAEEESKPLLAAGQKNHASNLKALLDGLASLKSPEEKLVSRAENLE